MRLNSLVRLILLFVEPTIVLDRFWVFVGGVVEVQPKLDAGSREVPPWTRFALRFDPAGISALGTLRQRLQPDDVRSVGCDQS